MEVKGWEEAVEGVRKNRQMTREKQGNVARCTSMGAILLFLMLAMLSCSAARNGSEPTVKIGNDRATVRGIVSENVRRCEVDGPCYLVLSGKSVNVRLYYHHGEYPACLNQNSTKIGLSAKPGDRIEAFGVHSFVDRFHIVDLCCPDCMLVLDTQK